MVIIVTQKHGVNRCWIKDKVVGCVSEIVIKQIRTILMFFLLCQINVGKMESAREKWNLIIGNLALKQVGNYMFSSPYLYDHFFTFKCIVNA